MCASAHVRVRARARARARSLVATLPGGGPAEDGSELRSHACGVAKVEARAATPPRRLVGRDIESVYLSLKNRARSERART